MRVHLSISPGRYACGVGRRWASQQITSTRSLTAVTCRVCRRVSEAPDLDDRGAS